MLPALWDARLLKQALTHRSANKAVNNERLELLGDAVLYLAIAQVLLTRHPDMSEGDVSKLRSQLNSRPHLARCGERLRLAEYLMVRDGHPITDAMLEDTIEALIGALYTDQGLDIAVQWIADNIVIDTEPDYKSRLYERYGSKFLRWQYTVGGPTHNPVHCAVLQFTLRDHVMRSYCGVGKSKAEAEQLACKRALEEVQKR